MNCEAEGVWLGGGKDGVAADLTDDDPRDLFMAGITFALESIGLDGSRFVDPTPYLHRAHRARGPVAKARGPVVGWSTSMDGQSAAERLKQAQLDEQLAQLRLHEAMGRTSRALKALRDEERDGNL